MSEENETDNFADDVDRTLSIPEFLPSIPSHLLGDCTDREKFTLERISVLIQQNKWQMEMLRRFYEQRNEHKRKFAELYDHKIEQQIKEAEQRGSKKWKLYVAAVLIFIAYPLYLAGASELGLLRVIKLF
jgi:hypothetical protein